MLGRLLRFRGLLLTLTARELKARYRGSLLGFLWSLVNPLLLLAVYSFVFGVVFSRAGGAEPYAVFLITGLFPWIWVSGALLEGTMSLIANAGLLRKAVFPAEVLPVVAVLANLVHFLLALPIVAALAVARFGLGHPVGGWGPAAAPGDRRPAPHDRRPRSRARGAQRPLQGRPRPAGQPAHPAFFVAPIIYPLTAVARVRPLVWLIAPTR